MGISSFLAHVTFAFYICVTFFFAAFWLHATFWLPPPAAELIVGCPIELFTTHELLRAIHDT